MGAGKCKLFNTPVTVKFLATEGMRTYNRGNYAGDDALMRTIRSQCKLLCEKYSYTFLAAEILHGKLEAMGAWVDANCRYPNKDGTPVGIMEVGGASMQIMSQPGRDGIYCNASFGKDAAMRTIVKGFNQELAKSQKEKTTIERDLKSVKNRQTKKKKTNPYPMYNRGDRDIEKLKREEQKLRKDLKTLEAARRSNERFANYSGGQCSDKTCTRRRGEHFGEHPKCTEEWMEDVT